MRYRYRILWLLLICAPRLAGAQTDAQATLSGDPLRLTVGDQSRVFLSVQHDPKLSRVAWPVVPDSFGKLEVVEKAKIDTVTKGRFVQYTQRLMVTGFDSGEFVIPPFTVDVTPNGAAPYQLTTSPLNILVQTLDVDTTKPIKPIKGIMIVESSWLDYLWYIIGAGVLLLAVILYFALRKKPKPVVVEPAAPPVPLHVRTLNALDELEKKQLWQRNEVKEYYVGLTDILRGYIEARFAVPAMERTTDELTAAARQHAELCRHVNPLYTILSTADMAKFARAQPMPDEHVNALRLTREFVTATVPQPAPSPKPNPGQQP